jgi:acetyl-CoA carboxylase, biotin carboxylase subunit
MFKKILVANRGEIALRVIRACDELGIASVAVYSEVDRASLHVMRAREAYAIGLAPATESYLNIEKILEVARRSRADAIHPGYGFLSENPSFARACRDRGITFIGPSPEAMELMGSKTRAREEMERAGVPLVGGSSRLNSVAEAQRIARDLGYPVMLKAAAGGGGKGMRLVSEAEELPSALEAAQSEATRAFGNGEVYLEKAVVNPRHVEMQILADEHGKTLYLGERDCSVQRRHQKVLEESPSPAATAEMRKQMGEVAVKVAQAAGYRNAGTVEFLVDEKGKFFFLEMNTRLQVEHPVTELVTGLDLVELQIQIAAGEPLRFSQADVALRGHAIECRIYAEDPENDYFPSPGNITALVEPAGPGIRVDSGIYSGWRVPLEYDPLLAKLIGYGASRPQAIRRLTRALSEYVIGGVKTNLALFDEILSHPDFVAGMADTGLLTRLKSRSPSQPLGEEAEIAVLAAGIFQALDGQASQATNLSLSSNFSSSSPWKRAARNEALRQA